ncbi:extracellular solute-binding protein [Streptomyces sp. Ru87]|uniref:extracellular solute-binding protein n=1 Tax=Streptomyces sp. Ru87 TaxID=2044307 RepID=UPI0015D4ECD9|nr:extracellular solute-binding protein [Streptomyces sp. Ru87]
MNGGTEGRETVGADATTDATSDGADATTDTTDTTGTTTNGTDATTDTTDTTGTTTNGTDAITDAAVRNRPAHSASARPSPSGSGTGWRTPAHAARTRPAHSAPTRPPRSVRARPGPPARVPRRAAPRRLLLLCLALALAVTALPGCGGPTGTQRGVTILAPWTEEEAAAFEALLDQFTDRTGIEVNYQGTPAQREVLLSEVQAGTAPDLAVIPGPGELADYARNRDLIPLDGIADPGEYDEPWLARPAGEEHTYWLPVKADLKSIVWHEKGAQPERFADDPARWCVGMGADAIWGWPGSDWIEDILLQQSGTDVYEKWVTGKLPWTSPEVRRAWTTWGGFLTPDGARRALLTDYRGPDGGDGLLFDPGADCDLEHQGSFARVHIYHDRADETDFELSSEILPRARSSARHREVSGDYVAMFQDSDEGRQLMAFLVSADTQRTWAESSRTPVFSANSRVTPASYGDEVDRRIARELREADALCLDASDAMPPPVRNVFHQKILEYLADPGDVDTVLEDLQRLQDSLDPAETSWLSSVCG